MIILPRRNRRRFPQIFTAALIVAFVILPLSPAAAAPSVRPFGPTIDGYASYEPQTRCLSVVRPGVAAFRDLVLAAYPGTRDGGVVRGCSVGGRSEHKEGRAWDWTVNASNPSEARAAQDLINWLLATDEHGNRHAMARRLGVMYIIWDRQIYSSYNSFAVRAYTGYSPHTDHVHVSFSNAGADARTSFYTAPDLTLTAKKPVPGPFPDVHGDSRYAEEVEWLAETGITYGRADGNFDLGAAVTRSQMSAFLHRLLGEPETDATNPFPDVSAAKFYSDAVDWLAEEGVVVGNADGTFAPDEPIRRRQMAVMLWRLAGSPEPAGISPFEDVPTDAHYARAVAWLYDHKITVGRTDDTYEPAATITRAQMALMLWRLASTDDAWVESNHQPAFTP